MPTVEKILEYFGTYTPGVDGAVSAFKFEYLTSLALRPSSFSWATPSSSAPRCCGNSPSPPRWSPVCCFPSWWLC